MDFHDRDITCIDCGLEFVFTAGEQLFFHDKQFKNDPRHCNGARRNVTMDRGQFDQKPEPHALSAGRGPRFPSNQRKAAMPYRMSIGEATILSDPLEEQNKHEWHHGKSMSGFGRVCPT